MSQYAYDYQSLTLHDLNNLVYLRSDIHQAFDDKGFVFIPKAGSVSIYFLRPYRPLHQYQSLPAGSGQD